ncbi:hypothetical protein Glove_166g158 [Diversispora epigaea]|uniref:HMG box domain-containing protein n=1 Tax=Diversispora epigaea TaxID=1348612 RepID=A0A397IZV7_9GLOM|nr:hypothetical protein Glove_166g158 [Diversispora epigaea]
MSLLFNKSHIKTDPKMGEFKPSLNSKQQDLYDSIDWDAFWEMQVTRPEISQPRNDDVPRWHNPYMIMKSEVSKFIRGLGRKCDGVDITKISANVWKKATDQQRKKYKDTFNFNERRIPQGLSK